MIFVNNRDLILKKLLEHISIASRAIIIALCIAIPLGILLTRKQRIADFVIGITGIFQTIPSLALFGLLLPFVGIGVKPTIIALVLYALLPICRNVYTGIKEVDKSVIDAGRGMGMTNLQILFNIELPLALPVIMAGVRTATVWTIGITTIAAYIGAGGLGEIIQRGVSLLRTDLILAGAVPSALLALTVDLLLKNFETAMTPSAKINRKKKSKSALSTDPLQQELQKTA